MRAFAAARAGGTPRVARASVAAMVAAVSMGVPTRILPAQSGSSCTVTPATVQANDVCQKARDLFTFLAPQLGIAVAGGNPIPGEGGSLGGPNYRSVSLRVIAVEGYIPDNEVPIRISGGAQSSDFGARRVPVPVPSLDVAFGVLSGFPVGVSNVGGVDLLGGITYIPTIERAPYKLSPRGGGLAFSYGARIGILQESSFVPGIGVSYMHRRLPKVSAAYTPGNDTLQINDTQVDTEILRATISKRFGFFGVAGGVGSDRIETTSGLLAVVNETIVGVPQRATIALPIIGQRITRKTAFVNASVGRPQLRLTGEVGWSSEGSLRQTVNTFGTHRANEGYRYGSLGLGFRF